MSLLLKMFYCYNYPTPSARHNGQLCQGFTVFIHLMVRFRTLPESDKHFLCFFRLRKYLPASAALNFLTGMFHKAFHIRGRISEKQTYLVRKRPIAFQMPDQLYDSVFRIPRLIPHLLKYARGLRIA